MDISSHISFALLNDFKVFDNRKKFLFVGDRVAIKAILKDFKGMDKVSFLTSTTVEQGYQFWSSNKVVFTILQDSFYDDAKSRFKNGNSFYCRFLSLTVWKSIMGRKRTAFTWNGHCIRASTLDNVWLYIPLTEDAVAHMNLCSVVEDYGAIVTTDVDNIARCLYMVVTDTVVPENFLRMFELIYNFDGKLLGREFLQSAPFKDGLDAQKLDSLQARPLEPFTFCIINEEMAAGEITTKGGVIVYDISQANFVVVGRNIHSAKTCLPINPTHQMTIDRSWLHPIMPTKKFRVPEPYSTHPYSKPVEEKNIWKWLETFLKKLSPSYILEASFVRSQDQLDAEDVPAVSSIASKLDLHAPVQIKEDGGMENIFFDTSSASTYFKICSMLFDTISSQRLYEESLKITEEVFMSDGTVEPSAEPVRISLPKPGAIMPGSGIVCRTYVNTDLDDKFPAIIAMYYSMGSGDKETWIMTIGDLLEQCFLKIGVAAQLVEKEDDSVVMIASRNGASIFEVVKFKMIEDKSRARIIQLLLDRAAIRVLTPTVLPSTLAKPAVLIVCGDHCMCSQVQAIKNTMQDPDLIQNLHFDPGQKIVINDFGSSLIVFSSKEGQITVQDRTTGKPRMQCTSVGDLNLQKLLRETDEEMKAPNLPIICQKCANCDNVVVLKLLISKKCSICGLMSNVPLIIIPSEKLFPSKC